MPKTHAVGAPTLEGHVDATAGVGAHPEWVPTPAVVEPEPELVVESGLGPELVDLPAGQVVSATAEPEPAAARPSPRKRTRG